jgi:uroporphyrin-III C-methyltransferase/precorrin-2 dehydrogenase/sirohydrochlorin ferrochelatase
MQAYLLGLRLGGRRVVVVGGGAVATRRIPALLDAGADVELISPDITASLEGLADSGRIRWTRRGFASGDCHGAWLVCACAGDAAVNAAVAAEAEEHRIWCVRADDRSQSAAWTPASGGAGDVRIGVLTGNPRRSAAIRDAILRSAALVRRDPAEGPRDSAESARGSAESPRGQVAIVGGGPGDPGLITVRGRELLGRADVVVTDRLAPRSLLDELPGDVEIVDAAKIPYGRAMAQEHINQALIDHARQGKFVVRLKGGDPFVFGRGAEEVLACLGAGIPVTVVPGVTSATGVPTAAGLPVTHRGVAQDFHVVSVHVPPDDERSTVDWRALAASTGTLVLLMAVERIGAITDTLISYGRNPSTPVSVIADGTLPSQRTIDSTLERVASLVVKEGIRPPAIVVVGEVVGVAAEIAELTRSEPATPDTSGRQKGLNSPCQVSTPPGAEENDG